MHPHVDRCVEVLARARAANGRPLEDKQRDRQKRDRGHLLVNVLGDGIDRGLGHEKDHEQGGNRPERKGDGHAGEHRNQCRGPIKEADGEDAHCVLLGRGMPLMTCNAICTERSVIPNVMSEYGIQSGGPHVDPEWYPSVQASFKSSHDFQAKYPQKRKLAQSTRISRTALARFGSKPTTASMATCPRRTCTAAADMNTAPMMRNTEVSSCQSV